MTRLIVPFTLMIATVASANTYNLQFTDFTVDNGQNVWTYSVTYPKSDKSLVVRLEIPETAYVTPVSQHSLRQKRSIAGTLRLEFARLETQNQTITFEVVAPENMTKNGKIAWTIESGTENPEGTVAGPVILNDSSNIRFVIAAGGSYICGNNIDFKMQNSVLLIKNDNRLRPSLVFGTLVRLGERWKPFDFLLSLEFANGTSRILNGFVFGLGLEWNKNLEFYVGMSVSMQPKISDGFKDAAEQLVAEIKKLPDTEENKRIKLDFVRFEKLETDKKTDKKTDKDFDGFPTISPISKEQIFPGDPLINRTNYAFVFGVAVPFEIIKGIGF